MNLFSYKADVFGLDISDLSLKIANVEKKRNGFELVSFGASQIKPGVVKDGQVHDEAALVKEIQQALPQVNGKKIKTKDVVCCLPEEKSFLDVLQIPILKEDETVSAIKFEAANHIPVPLDDVYFDFEIQESLNSIGVKNHKPVSEKQHQNVLIAATPKAIVEAYLSVMKKAGLRPRVMEVEPLSIARALINKENSARSFLIIDFGSTRTSFIIFSGHTVGFSSTIPISSNELTEKIAEKLDIVFKEAEKMKQTQGLEGDKKVFDAMCPTLTDLTRQIKSHLDYYKSHVAGSRFSSGKVERILLCGGGSKLKGLADFLASTFKLRVELSDPLANITKLGSKLSPKLSSKDFLGYSTALGLALRGIQL